ncbi:hypothetical protein [Marinobacter arenosus]|uniref:hypothetical protein n=1 Tax=Marinobacter arenosus TaxID=2856822 RepID=UPI001C4B24CC|nr:hypothetical protein [Marinobacter arenosus]MBW0146203.1 hypothetical protein [Marinobacter arenosus]
MKLQKLLQIACLPILFGTALTSDEAFSAEADGKTFPDRGMIQLGALFVFDSDTTVSASGATAGIGTTIDFANDLDGDSTITTPSFETYYRFNSRHRLELAAFQLERDGSRVITREITFRDRTFSRSVEIDSSINNDIYKLAYAYSFYHVDRVELAVSAGFNVLDYEVRLASSAGDFVETASTTAPMPVFGFRMDYAVTPRLTARFRTDSFYFDFEDKIRGSLLELQVGAEYRLMRNFALGASLSRLAIAVDVDDDDFDGRVDDLYRGARIYGSFYF